jgi:hypothetical protein
MDDRTQAMNFIPSLSIQPTQQPPQNNERDIFVEHVSLQPLKKNVGMLVQFEANRIKMEFQILPGAAIPLLGDTLRRTFSCHKYSQPHSTAPVSGQDSGDTAERERT